MNRICSWSGVLSALLVWNVTLADDTAGNVAPDIAQNDLARFVAWASAVTGEVVVHGGISTPAGVEVATQTFAGYAGEGVWRLKPGLAMELHVDLPEGFLNLSIRIDELGWLDNAPDMTIDVQVNGFGAEIPCAPPKAVLIHELASLDAHLKPGPNKIVIANDHAGGSVGVLSVGVSYDLPAPTGSAEVSLKRSPRPSDTFKVKLTVVSPAPGQCFAADSVVPIEWETEGFPPGSGVALHYRQGDGAWTPIEDAQALPFNHPFAEGNRGLYPWRPGTPLEDVQIGLDFVRIAEREPVTITVGGERGVKAITHALDLVLPGDTIVLKPGTYTEHVKLPPGVSLVGEDRERCVLTILQDRGGARSRPGRSQPAVMLVTGGRGARVANLTITSEERLTGMKVDDADLSVENVTFRGLPIAVEPANGSDIRLSNVLFEDNATAIRVVKSKATLSECRVSGTRAGRAALVEGGGSLELHDVIVQVTGQAVRNNGDGTHITLKRCDIVANSGVMMAGNSWTLTMEDCKLSAIVRKRGMELGATAVGGRGDGTLTLKRCEIVAAVGVNIDEGAWTLTMADCKLSGIVARGLDLEGTRGMAGISRTSITGGPEASVYGAVGVFARANVRLDSVTIENVPGTGIDVGSPGSTEIRHCVVTGCRTGIYVNGGASASVHNTTCRNNDGWGIYVQEETKLSKPGNLTLTGRNNVTGNGKGQIRTAR